MKRHFVLAVVGALCITAAVATAGNKTFSDASGDSGTAPDLTSVDVSDSGGLIVFKIAGTLAPSTSFEILLDTDANRSTGDDGDELWISVYQEGDGKSYWDADRWNGKKWDDNGRLDVVSRTYPGREELGIDAEEAGINGPFNFSVHSVKMVADAVEASDHAPDSIEPWRYELAAKRPVAPVLGQLRLSPVRASSGKALTVTVPVRRSDTNGALSGGTTTCTLRVGSRVATGRGTAAGGRGTCRLAVPGGSSGKSARGTIVVDYHGTSATKSFSMRIA
jgi:hypothetical protein